MKQTKASQADITFMEQAIALGREGLGHVAPNPSVGCLLVRFDGEIGTIVGRGVTQKDGRPHGEVMALREAGDAAKGAVAYVSLEPCSHQGQTPPCAQALIDAGVTRVVSALEDPDPRVSGRGHKMLADAGIEVQTGVAADAAAETNIGFLTLVKTGRPFVQLKLAVSADGMIAAAPGVETAITGEEVRVQVHHMRAKADAVMVGAGTWAADDPQLTCRAAGDHSPIRVVLDRRAELPLTLNLVQSAGEVPLWVVVDKTAASDAKDRLEAAGAQIIEGPGSEDLSEAGKFDLAALLTLLGGKGITRLLCEGGARVAQNLVSNDLVDELIIYQSTNKLGSGGVAAFADMSINDALSGFSLVREADVGADRAMIYRRRDERADFPRKAVR